MFASYEVATSFPSLTAIKGYDLDKSSDVPLMGLKKNDYTRDSSYMFLGPYCHVHFMADQSKS